jgi:hypothetical protein
MKFIETPATKRLAGVSENSAQVLLFRVSGRLQSKKKEKCFHTG